MNAGIFVFMMRTFGIIQGKHSSVFMHFLPYFVLFQCVSWRVEIQHILRLNSAMIIALIRILQLIQFPHAGITTGIDFGGKMKLTRQITFRSRQYPGHSRASFSSLFVIRLI